MLFDEVKNILNDCKDITIDASLLEIPQDRTKGDIALPCFSFAKMLKKAPQQIATDISMQLKPSNAISKIIATWSYINFFVNPARLAQHVLQDITKTWDKYGYAKKNWEHILLEWRQPNTHKIFHIWHLRNALVSESIARICEAGGYTVTRCSYFGDIWAHVAKRMRYYTTFDKSPVPTERVSMRAGKIYAKAGKKIDEDPETYKQAIHDIQHKLENKDPSLYPIRKETAQKCLEDIRAINHELWCTWIQREYPESEVEQAGIQQVKALAKNNTADIHESDGALIINLEEYSLGVFVLLKSNGTSLYSTKDIALAYLKQQEYDFDKSLYIVATEQIHHFNQLFKTLELIGYQDAEKLKHVSYGMVELAGWKMSSRDGNIITYYNLRDRMLDQAHTLVASRELVTEEKEKIATMTAFGALKFDMLLQDAYKKIVFDMEKSLSFEGETGPYIQYTHARCMSLLRKHEISSRPQNGDADYTLLTSEEERILLVMLHTFPSIIKKAAEEYKPNYVARYILELARSFNHYYHKTKIIQDDKVLQHVRIYLIQGIAQVLKNGLHLLWIAAPEHM